jgi:hypothetical protein
MMPVVSRIEVSIVHRYKNTEACSEQVVLLSGHAQRTEAGQIYLA